jgi:hypothetical protein
VERNVEFGVFPYCPDVTRVADPVPDLDPAFYLNADPDQAFRIQNLLLTKVMLICDHWFIGPPRLHFKPPGLNCERPRPPTPLFFKPLKLRNFDFNAELDPDPATPLMRIRIQLPN